MGLPLTASFGVPLPSFTSSNIWCFCMKPQQGTAAIALSVCVVHLNPLSLPPCNLMGGSTRRLGRGFSPGHMPWAVPGQGEDTARVTAPRVTWLNRSCGCRFSSPRRKEYFRCGSQFLLGAGWRHGEAGLGGIPGAELGWQWWAGMPLAPTAAGVAALPMGIPRPAAESTGSSASPTAAGVGAYAWIKESNTMAPVF